MIPAVQRDILFSRVEETRFKPIHWKKPHFFLAVMHHQINGRSEKNKICIRLLNNFCRSMFISRLTSF